MAKRKTPSPLQPAPRHPSAGLLRRLGALLYDYLVVIALLIIAGFIGMIATWIIHSFNDDVDYYVQVDEIERIEGQHFDNINKVA